MAVPMGKSRTIKFEQAVEQVEQIIEAIEAGDIGLEDSLAEYEKGMKLIAQCRAILESAEKRIAELSTNAQGELEVADNEP